MVLAAPFTKAQSWNSHRQALPAIRQLGWRMTVTAGPATSDESSPTTQPIGDPLMTVAGRQHATRRRKRQVVKTTIIPIAHSPIEVSGAIGDGRWRALGTRPTCSMVSVSGLSAAPPRARALEQRRHQMRGQRSDAVERSSLPAVVGHESGESVTV
jgi:hypothetical protein